VPIRDRSSSTFPRCCLCKICAFKAMRMGRALHANPTSLSAQINSSSAQTATLPHLPEAINA
jgi:hypothetical protein